MNGAERRADPRAVKGGAPRYKGRTEREAHPFSFLVSLVLVTSWGFSSPLIG